MSQIIKASSSSESESAEITAMERVGLARHPKRIYTSDIITNLFTDFVELKGDRRFADDPAITCGTADFNGEAVFIVGHQKGRDVNERRFRNFGMPKPEGYRKALRGMKLAEKFGRPIVTFIDTPGAYPGIDAEERGQAEAIANNLLQAAKIKVPILTVVIGEGGSGGALGIGVCDVLIMLENAVYSVISPEGCAAILWKSHDHTNLAAERLKLTAQNLSDLGVVDVVLSESGGAATNDNLDYFQHLARVLSLKLQEAKVLSNEERLRLRYERVRRMGRWLE